MRLYRTRTGFVVEEEGAYYAGTQLGWNELLKVEDLAGTLQASVANDNRVSADAITNAITPIGGQEVWAAGVTYYRSRDARMEESKSAGGGDFYDRVYSAERPELFFKSTPHRVAGPGGKVAIRSDASWSVPEPELTLLVSPRGRITGYTIGNDMSSRDIEGENPLYLPQAKVYNRSCALGPCILASNEPLEKSTEIRMEILRAGEIQFEGATTLAMLKRDPVTLVEYLFRDNTFPEGCFLMTGTGVVPPDSFTLQRGDILRITIAAIGTLVNEVG